MSARETVDHAEWDALLAAFLVEGADGVNRVAYGRLKADPAALARLDAYVASLAARDPYALSEPERKAYWINLYNALTVKVVAQAYPVASIRDISLGGGIAAFFTGGPWKAPLVTIAGEALSLDDIEHVKLRRDMPDERIHFAVNCASYGCPNLQPRAFRAAGLDARLDDAARAYVNHPRGLRLDDRGRLIASRIFDWYGSDFGPTRAAVLDRLKRYASAETLAMIEAAGGRIAGFDYDWSLNDAP